MLSLAGGKSVIERSNGLPVTNTRGTGLARLFNDWPFLYFIAALATWCLLMFVRKQIMLIRRVRDNTHVGE